MLYIQFGEVGWSICIPKITQGPRTVCFMVVVRCFHGAIWLVPKWRMQNDAKEKNHQESASPCSCNKTKGDAGTTSILLCWFFDAISVLCNDKLLVCGLSLSLSLSYLGFTTSSCISGASASAASSYLLLGPLPRKWRLLDLFMTPKELCWYAS